MNENTEMSPENSKDRSPVEQISELVRKLCIAQSNVHMYAIDHPVAKQAMQEAYEWIHDLIESKEKTITVSMSEGKMLFEGLPIEEKNPMVARLARSLEEIHANNLFFNPGLTLDEFRIFNDILHRGADYISEHGGFKKLMEEENISHIVMREASYVLITEEDKVVSRDARIAEDGNIPVEGSDEDNIIKYMIGEVMKKADEQKWLTNEIKNHPKKMAQRIIDGIELATSRAELGLESETDSIDVLLDNIKMVGQSLGDEAGSDDVNLEDAVMMLERELKMRSQTLMSSKVAGGFINEILGVITSFSDRVKAKKISDEFLRGETSLKKTEALLRSLAPQDTSKRDFLVGIHDLLVEKGMGEDELKRLISQLDNSPKKKEVGQETDKEEKEVL